MILTFKDRDIIGGEMTFLTKARLFVILFFLFACSASPPQSIKTEGMGRTIDIGSYTVDQPYGENWTIKINKQAGKVQFIKQSKALFGAGGLPSTMIQVSYNSVVQKNMWQMTEEEIANDYRDGEIDNMTFRGILPGLYELHDVKKDIITLDGKTFYTLSYKQMGGRWFGTDKFAESILYLYFPPSFKETHRFYLFLITEWHKRDKKLTAHLTPIIPIIKGFRLKIRN